MKNITRTHIVLLLVTVAWGLNNVALKLAVREIDPLALFVVRGCGSVVVILCLFQATQRRWSLRRSDLWRLMVVAIAGVTSNQLFFTIGIQHTSASNASMLMSTSPIFGLIFAILIAHERATWRRWAGVFLALFGVALIMGSAGGFSFSLASLKGDLIVMGAPIGWALYSVLGRPILKSHTPLQLTTFSWLIGWAAGLPLTVGPAFAQDWTGISPLAWAGAAFAGLCIPITTVIWNGSVIKLGASAALVFMYFVPVFAVLFAVLFLHETLTLLQIAGALVVLVGVNTARSEPGQSATGTKVRMEKLGRAGE